MGLSQSRVQKNYGNVRSNTSAFPLVRCVNGNAVVAQKYLRERRSPAFSHHYTPGY